MSSILNFVAFGNYVDTEPEQTPTAGVCLGDSTVAEYLGGTAIATLLFDAADIANGFSCASLAAPGNTINQQLNAWNAYTDKALKDWVIVQIGLNDLNPADSLSSALARYQTLIDTINASKKVGAQVLLATMIPCKQRLIDLYGAVNGLVSYQKWLDMNEAVLGQGATPITGSDFSFTVHTIGLNDGNGNLKAEYDLGDHIHENTEARTIIANVWKSALRHSNLY